MTKLVLLGRISNVVKTNNFFLVAGHAKLRHSTGKEKEYITAIKEKKKNEIISINMSRQIQAQ